MNQSINFNAARAVGPAGMDSLDKSIQNVNLALQADNSYLDLSDLLNVLKFCEPNVSGTMEHDYPSLGTQTGRNLHQIGQIKKTSLPPELVERFAYMQCNCLMGLFPAIKRAWLSIDSDIFMWNYEDGSDVAYFDGLSETILCAALVKPKPDIFQPHIVYLLCLATAVDIVLLGVSFGQCGDEAGVHSKFEEMHLLPEPLFAVPTDNVHMSAIQSTDSGRIFMAGRDGCLHELYYQAEEGWFSRRCRKINHSQSSLSFLLPPFLHFSDVDPLTQITIDESRHLLYTLSEKGDIQVMDIGAGVNSKAARGIALMSRKTIVHSASVIARNSDRGHFHPIVHIAAVTKQESTNINLVAVTHTGTRFYFTTTRFPDPQGLKLMPCMLTLVHVRFPPGHTIHSSQGSPKNVHSAFYSRGVLMMAASQSEDVDQLWVLSDDAFPFQRLLSESHELNPLVGRTWSMAEVPCSIPSCALAPVAGPERPDPPSVVTQHLQIERQFVIINSLGTTILTKLNPVDQLQQLLVQFGPDSEQLKSYFKHHKEQACATCLVLMCSRSLAHQQVNDLATRAFFLYSGEPDYAYGYPQQLQQQQQLLGPRTSNTPGCALPAASTPIPNVTRHLSFQSPGASMIVPPSPGGGGVHPGTPMAAAAGPGSMPESVAMFGASPLVVYSNKHKSLYLYLARLLRPLWQNRMVTEIYQTMKTGGKVTHLTSVFDGEQLVWILRKLTELKDFLDINMAIFMPASAGLMSNSFAIGQNLPSSQRTPYQSRMMGATSTVDEQAAIRLRAAAEADENISLKQFHQLIILTCEYLGLWKILCDHQFNIIAKTLSQEQNSALQNATFEQLVTGGRDVCQALAKRLVDMYIDDNAATDIINGRLREVCPSLYSCADEMYSKGYEKLKSAKTVGCGTDRDHFVAEALELFKGIASRVDLPSVCSQFAMLKYYNSIVDLVLTAAAKRDPQNLALHFYQSKKPPADVQGSQAYNIRMDCYRVIMETIEYLLSTTHFNPQAPSVPKSPGPPPAHDTGRLTSAEAEHHIAEMYDLILRSKDQMVHVSFFDWLIANKMSEKLFEIQSPYLEQYLMQGSAVGVGGEILQMQMMDLLWKYYEKQRNFLAAARILASLAEKPGLQVPLHQRIEYLSRAAMCAKSCTSHTTVPGEGEFLHELEEKMEVARLQIQISDILAKNRSMYQHNRVDQALERLNAQLYEISVLYSEFAEAFELSECKLAIVHCAGHFDLTLVETLWREIIDKEFDMTAGLEAIVRVQSLYTKLVAQGKKYIGSENYFPLATLVRYLEKLSCSSHLDDTDPTFVFRAMLDLGIGLPRLFDIYDKTYKVKETGWKANRKPYHLLYVICLLLGHFAMRPQMVSSNERLQFTTKALDAVASYLVELQAETNVRVTDLMNELRDLQAHLQRVA